MHLVDKHQGNWENLPPKGKALEARNTGEEGISPSGIWDAKHLPFRARSLSGSHQASAVPWMLFQDQRCQICILLWTDPTQQQNLQLSG